MDAVGCADAGHANERDEVRQGGCYTHTANNNIASTHHRASKIMSSLVKAWNIFKINETKRKREQSIVCHLK